MSEKKPENPHAFPYTSDYGIKQGMTLRDYFAGQALVGILASLPPNVDANPIGIATFAHECADAMLRVREAKP